MKIINCRLPNVYEIYTKRFSDSRGSFTEAFNSKEIKNITGKEFKVCQVNKSISKKGVLRGLHFQKNSPQSKIVLVTKGRIQEGKGSFRHLQGESYPRTEKCQEQNVNEGSCQ